MWCFWICDYLNLFNYFLKKYTSLLFLKQQIVLYLYVYFCMDLYGRGPTKGTIPILLKDYCLVTVYGSNNRSFLIEAHMSFLTLYSTQVVIGKGEHALTVDPRISICSPWYPHVPVQHCAACISHIDTNVQLGATSDTNIDTNITLTLITILVFWTRLSQR